MKWPQGSCGWQLSACCMPLCTGGCPGTLSGSLNAFGSMCWDYLSCLFALVAVVLLTYQRYDSAEVQALSVNQSLVVLPFVLVTVAVILFAVLTLVDYERLARENRLASLREVYYQGIRREQTQVRTLRHDLCNHLTVLQGLVEHGDREKVQAYLEQIVGSSALQGSRQLCENEVANAVVTAKAEAMERNGLIRDLQITLPPEPPVADTDLCALLGNALDNAMEAADKAGDKKIFMRCQADKGMLMLKVRNALAGDEREVPGLFLSYGSRF